MPLHPPPPSPPTIFYPSFPAAPRFFPPPSPKPVAPSSCPRFSHPCSFWVLMKRIWGSRGGARGSRWEPLCFCSSEGESGGEKTGQKKEGSALCLHPAFPKNPELLQQVGYFPQTSSFFSSFKRFLLFLHLMNEKHGSKPRSAPRPPASPRCFCRSPLAKDAAFFNYPLSFPTRLRFLSRDGIVVPRTGIPRGGKAGVEGLQGGCGRRLSPISPLCVSCCVSLQEITNEGGGESKKTTNKKKPTKNPPPNRPQPGLHRCASLRKLLQTESCPFCSGFIACKCR